MADFGYNIDSGCSNSLHRFDCKTQEESKSCSNQNAGGVKWCGGRDFDANLPVKIINS